MNIIDILTTQSDIFTVGIYFFITIIAILESIPMFGFLVPGQIVAVTGGILAHLGSLDITTVIIFLSIGTIFGDLIGYYIGKKYGESFILKYGKYFFIKPQHFSKTQALILEHTGKTLVIGRFNSVTRAFAPFVAGAAQTPFLKFLFFIIIGGISWASCFSLLGFAFGQSYKTITSYIGEFLLVALILGAVIIYLYKFFNKKRHIFDKRHLYILLINLFSLYIFTKMLENFVNQDLLISLDQWLNLHLATIQNPILNTLMIFTTNLADSITITIGGIILLIFFITQKKWRYSLILILSLSGGKILEVSIKYIIGRDRPTNAIIEATGYSFPSGHATIAVIFFLILIYYFKNHLTHRLLKYLLMTLGFLIILGVGFSRIYLGAHWFSDVIAGFALGIFWLTLLILVLEAITTIFREKVAKIKKYLN